MKYRNVKLVAVAEDGTQTELLHPGEPFFLVRGQDRFAASMVAMYDGLLTTMSEKHGDEAHGELVLLRERILSWQRRNPGLVKTPD